MYHSLLQIRYIYTDKLQFMKRIALLFCLLTFSMTALGADNVRFWEQYSEAEKSHVFNSGSIKTSVVGVYDDSLAIGDNEEALKILDFLSDYKYGHHADGIVDAFYIHCFSKILRKADGALSEVMGEYCMRIIKKSPDYAILYLKAHGEIREAFVMHIGFEVLCSDNQDLIYENLRKCLKSNPSFAEEFVTAVKSRVLQTER